jgi:hypothetical protein
MTLIIIASRRCVCLRILNSSWVLPESLIIWIGMMPHIMFTNMRMKCIVLHTDTQLTGADDPIRRSLIPGMNRKNVQLANRLCEMIYQCFN